MTAHELGKIAPLPTDLQIVSGTDPGDLWEPFRFFEAGHHAMAIMNPLSDGGLDELIDKVGVSPGERVLDIACGHGDFIMRLAAKAPVSITGVDLSPWTIRRAHQRVGEAQERGQTAEGSTIELWLGDGRTFVEQRDAERWDVIALIGAPWVWGGFEPALRALTARLRPGGRVVIADIVASSAEARDRLTAEYGNPATMAEQRRLIEEANLLVIDEVATEEADWRAYDDRVEAGLRAWLGTFPDDRPYLDRHLAYEAERHDPSDAGWHVWVVGVA